VPQQKLPGGALEEAVRGLFAEPEKLVDMGQRALALAKPEARYSIVKHILKLAEA